jgi:hypothetical protein
MYALQRNEVVSFFDGLSEIKGLFIRKKGQDAEIKVTHSSVCVYEPGELAVVPMEALVIREQFSADDGSLDLHD